MRNEFSDQELLRYSRHILLPQVDVDGQLAVANGHALLVGLGGLGSPAALYLASSGVGRLTLADFDVVDESNLQRQIVHTQDRVGLNKADSAEQAIQSLNDHVQVNVVRDPLEGAGLTRAVEQADVVLDCCDNFATRKAVNRACLSLGKPLVSGAAIRFEGQLAVFDFREAAHPCYECLFPELADENLSCSQSGVFAPLVGMVGSFQALEALKILARCDRPAPGRLQLFDGLRSRWREFTFPRDPACPACGGACND